MANEQHMPAVGDVAPPISAVTATGDRFESEDHKGSWVALYFFPRANTPG